MFYAWNDGKRPYTTEDLETAISKIQPMAKGIMSDTVSALRTWSTTHGIRNANVAPKVQLSTNLAETKGSRVIRFEEGEEK